MASKKRVELEVEDSIPMDMSPMIDMTFLLLVFFMVASHLITVQIDRRVEPPTAKNAQVAKESSGRVVVNILADGSIWGQNEEELPTTEAIQDYVDQTRVRNEANGIPTRLNLRADRNVDTRDIKKVVQAAGEAGVSEVIFGSLTVEK
jgi:biopolymer transport protein ExbD